MKTLRQVFGEAKREITNKTRIKEKQKSSAKQAFLKLLEDNFDNEKFIESLFEALKEQWTKCESIPHSRIMLEWSVLKANVKYLQAFEDLVTESNEYNRPLIENQVDTLLDQFLAERIASLSDTITECRGAITVRDLYIVCTVK